MIFFNKDKNKNEKKLQKKLFAIILNGSVEELEPLITEHPELLDAATELEVKDGRGVKFLPGVTPLCYAADLGKDEMLSALINAGADVNKKCQIERTGWTPLHSAIEENQVSCIKILLAANAQIDKKDNNGKTAIDIAKTAEIKKLLDPNYIEPIKDKKPPQGFIKENDHMVSTTTTAEASCVTIRKIFDFENEVVITQVKDKDGQSSFEKAFKDASAPKQIEKAAKFLMAKGGDTHGFKPSLKQPIS